jgi:hypothetical protein
LLSLSAVRPDAEWTLSETICTNSANDRAGPVLFGAGGANGAGALENPKYPLMAGGNGPATGAGGGGLASSAFAVDRDFGPFFLKFCTYFPFNGHEYAKQQLARKGIAFEALDNGILSCADPARLQQICNGLSAAKIEGLLRKWLRLLPHPFTGADRAAGYRYDISILQAEFSFDVRKALAIPCPSYTRSHLWLKSWQKSIGHETSGPRRPLPTPPCQCNHSMRLTFLSLHKSTLVESVFDPSA